MCIFSTDESLFQIFFNVLFYFISTLVCNPCSLQSYSWVVICTYNSLFLVFFNPLPSLSLPLPPVPLSHFSFLLNISLNSHYGIILVTFFATETKIYCSSESLEVLFVVGWLQGTIACRMTEEKPFTLSKNQESSKAV